MSQTVPALRIRDGESVNYTPSSTAVNAGDVVLLGSVVSIAVSPIAVNQLGDLMITGVFRCPKDSSSFSAGDPVYWNGSNMTSTASGNTFAGRTYVAQVTGDSTVDVKLSGAGPLGNQFGTVASPAAFAASANDLSVAANVFHLRVTTDNNGPENLTGITGGVDGRMIIISNVGATDSIVIKHDATSTAANRFYGSGSADVTLHKNASVYAIYDGTSSRWRVGTP